MPDFFFIFWLLLISYRTDSLTKHVLYQLKLERPPIISFFFCFCSKEMYEYGKQCSFFIDTSFCVTAWRASCMYCSFLQFLFVGKKGNGEMKRSSKKTTKKRIFKIYQNSLFSVLFILKTNFQSLNWNWFQWLTNSCIIRRDKIDCSLSNGFYLKPFWKLNFFRFDAAIESTYINDAPFNYQRLKQFTSN